MLSTDFAEFVDLLPALEALVRLAEKLAGPDDDAPAGYSGSPTVWRPNRREARRPRPRELVRMYGMVEELASSRVRRTHPLKRPGAGLAVHGHAGHQLPRDAFVVFVESLARHLGHGGGAILVLDSPGVGLSCEPAPGGAVAIQVSTMALHHPLHWASAHELAHALFEQRSPPPAVTRGCERVDVRLFEAAAELRVASKVELRGADSLAVHLRAMVTDLEDAGAVSTKRDLAAALASLAEEVPADLLLRDSLALPKDSPAQTSARFWFVMGPCLLFDLQDSFGATPLPDVVVQTLLLRFWLVERLVEGQLQPEAWAEGLSMLVETGRRVASPKPGDPPFTEGSFGRLLVSVKEDLGIPNPIWHKALTRFEGLLDDLDSEEELARDLAAVVAAWLKLVQAVRAKLAPALERDEGDPWLGFTRYVQRLMKPCHFSYPTGELAGPVEGDWQVASPWPPFVRDHGHARDSLVTDNQRWTEEGVVISRRGGVMAGRNGQRHYNRMTTDFVLEMDAAVRHSRLDKLLAYLRRPGGEL
jgi:hypothetical protein